MTPSRWAYFTVEELSCHCGCGQCDMDDSFMRKMVAFRDILGFALPVNSGFRCPKHNHEVGGVEKSAHAMGLAVDVAVSRYYMTMALETALNLGFRGVGLKQHGPDSGRYMHLDMMDRPEVKKIVWTYP